MRILSYIVMGRSPKLTKRIQDDICNAIKVGATYQDAARYAGIGYSTFFDWLATGRLPKAAKRYVEFVEAVEGAKAECNINMTAIIVKAAAEGDWRAALEYLKRRDRDNWGDGLDLTSKDGGITFKVVYGTDGEAAKPTSKAD